jgi:hypothetical protein
MSSTPQFSDKITLEKYSSAFTLSDMEIFVFPELLFPLVIANIMSPIIWTWREDGWFKDIHKKSFNYKINRIKQYIMDHYVFNLDLETWGLTNKDTEIERFKDSIDIDILKQSNALFGYEGDKYYFDIDIRRHFGLDKYTSDIIPYWKTETVEAMTAFRFKYSFDRGAGECVSLSALYAAALFIVGGIPLEHIFLIGTPLHSQNFINLHEGILTNNRRLVTKKMWFNGTSISTRARRALEHEKVTIVSHISGYIHHLYEKATINKKAYLLFSEKLSQFLTAPLSAELFINFLRYHMKFKKCFQYRHYMNARNYYIPLETLLEYEHSTKYILSESSRDALLNEIDDEEFDLAPISDRIILQDVETYLSENKEATVDDLEKYCLMLGKCISVHNKENKKILFRDLHQFLRVEPQLPVPDKQFITTELLKINNNLSRDEIIRMIKEKAPENELALLSLYAYRDIEETDWRPFIKAALERNPVSLEGLKGKTADDAYRLVCSLPDDSIYDGKRLAQPDEVWNFGRGDGIEKALLFANFLRNEMNSSPLTLIADKAGVTLKSGNKNYVFHSQKEIVRQVNLTDNYT